MRKLFNTKNLMRFIFATFVASTIYVVVEIIIAPSVAPPDELAVRIKSDYIFLLLQCLFGVAAMLLPRILEHRIGLDIPDTMLIIYAVFLYCGIYLGEVREFYYIVPHWDTILHAFSGVGLGALGFSIVSILNKSDSVPISLSPGFVAFFAFCFAVALGVVWEVYEFIMDVIFDSNMQTYANEIGGEPMVGRDALADTMKDLILDAVGALLISVIGYVSLKHKKGWLSGFHIKRKRPAKNK